jgi:hypothetical protein
VRLLSIRQTVERKTVLWLKLSEGEVPDQRVLGG